MHPELDLFTLRLSSTLASAAFGLVFATLWRGRRRDDHLLYWAASSLLYALDLIGFEVFPRAPLAVGMMLYGMLSVVNILAVSGLRRIERRPAFAPWMIGLAGATMAFFAIPVLACRIWPVLPVSLIPISHASGLIVSMAVTGGACIRSGKRSASRAGAIAGCAMLAYIPGYLLAIAAELGWSSGASGLALVAMVSDQLLLGVLNLGLLAVPNEQAHVRLREAALRDPLTKCWNRAGLAEIAARKHGKGIWAVIALDIDNFKPLNDSFGHAAGDVALEQLAMLAMAAAGPHNGEVIRLGGDEFLILLPDGDEHGARIVSQTLEDGIRTLPRASPWTVSMGTAFSLPENLGLSATICRADAALYTAKRQGPGRVAA
ncbi:sensor domain-containing diguanylate cyclase [Novosphingobium sp. 9]|uniref:GGDEF domain-containing protein n=1 Tax=Novosphingobium sp. 9 TaxID=2025349 RepID=UPI0021B68131|nr:diguanylate cyclase [Novosphingobium sp. 9]